MASQGVQSGSETFRVRRELVEAHTNASTRNPLPISIVRAIRYKRENISVNGAQMIKDRSLSVCMEAGKCCMIMAVER